MRKFRCWPGLPTASSQFVESIVVALPVVFLLVALGVGMLISIIRSVIN